MMAMTKSVSKFIATLVVRGSADFFLNSQMHFLAGPMCIRLPSFAFQLPPNESEKPTAGQIHFSPRRLRMRGQFTGRKQIKIKININK